MRKKINHIELMEKTEERLKGTEKSIDNIESALKGVMVEYQCKLREARIAYNELLNKYNLK